MVAARGRAGAALGVVGGALLSLVAGVEGFVVVAAAAAGAASGDSFSSGGLGDII